MKTKLDGIRKQLQLATLESQGLTQLTPFGSGKDATLRTLEHLGYVQIDTLSVVERAHHHTLWTRIPDYQSRFLNQLVEERSAFEYWFHAASYLPMKDFRFVLPQMDRIKRGEIRYHSADPKSIQFVLDKIRLDGPQKSRDFENSSKKAGQWWDWKPTKRALEKLFMQGDLMVTERIGMEKIYDLTERVLPNSVDTSEPNVLELAEFLTRTYLRAYGFTTVKQITHLRSEPSIRKHVEEFLQSLLEDRTVQQIKLDGAPAIYVQSHLLEKSIQNPPPKIRFLSPFDNSIIHRDRIKQIFDFDYRLECYIPNAKRQYGYFSLPILFGDTFIGRVDCKAHRKTGQFELIHLHIEDTHLDIERWGVHFVESIREFAGFNDCKSILLSKVSPKTVSKPLKRLFD